MVSRIVENRPYEDVSERQPDDHPQPRHRYGRRRQVARLQQRATVSAILLLLFAALTAAYLPGSLVDLVVALRDEKERDRAHRPGPFTKWRLANRYANTKLTNIRISI